MLQHRFQFIAVLLLSVLNTMARVSSDSVRGLSGGRTAFAGVWGDSIPMLNRPDSIPMLNQPDSFPGLTQPDSIPMLTRPDSSVSFLVLGDWGRNGSPEQLRVAGKMGEAADVLQASFILVTGDNFYDNGVRDTADSQWETSFENVYTAASLQVPWYVVLGNHDYHLDPDAQVLYTRKGTRWQMPARYYSFTRALYGDSLLFVFLDTDPIEKEFLGRVHDPVKYPEGAVARQLSWLENVLASSHAKWKIVVGHHPLHTGGARRHNSRTRKLRDILQPVFYRYGVDLYLAGHEHHLEYLKPPAGPTHYIISGAGSEARHVGWLKRYRRFAARKKGFAAVSIGPSDARIRFIDQSGRILYSHGIVR